MKKLMASNAETYKVFHFKDFTLKLTVGVMDYANHQLIIDTRFDPAIDMCLSDLVYAPDWDDKDKMCIYVISGIWRQPDLCLTKLKLVKYFMYVKQIVVK